MHDVRTLLDPATNAAARLARRGFVFDRKDLENLYARRNTARQDVDHLHAKSRQIAHEVRRGDLTRENVDDLREQARSLKKEAREAQNVQRDLDAKLRELLL